MTTDSTVMDELDIERDVLVEELIGEKDGQPDPIDRGELSNRLADLGVTLDEHSFDAATEERARELWQWMEMNADFVDSENPKGDWLAVLPIGFQAAGEGEQCVVKLVEKPKEEEKKVTAEKHLELIKEVSANANRLRDLLIECESDVKAAKARMAEARENLDRAEIELSAVIADARSGQQRLPFGDQPANGADKSDSDGIAATANDQSPINELGVKQIKKLIGAVEFDRLKSIDEPVGLSDSVLEKLEQAELATISDLEKLMQENQYWWEAAGIAKDGHAQCVQRVISTLLVYRKSNP